MEKITASLYLVQASAAPLLSLFPLNVAQIPVVPRELNLVTPLTVSSTTMTLIQSELGWVGNEICRIVVNHVTFHPAPTSTKNFNLFND